MLILARMPGGPAVEQVLDVGVWGRQEAARTKWGPPIETKPLPFPAASTPFELAQYQPGLLALLEGKVIRLILVQEGFRGHSARGITLGSAAAEVRARYGTPTRVVPMPEGVSWVYEAQGIAFRVREGAVVSWQVF